MVMSTPLPDSSPDSPEPAVYPHPLHTELAFRGFALRPLPRHRAKWSVIDRKTNQVDPTKLARCRVMTSYHHQCERRCDGFVHIVTAVKWTSSNEAFHDPSVDLPLEEFETQICPEHLEQLS